MELRWVPNTTKYCNQSNYQHFSNWLKWSGNWSGVLVRGRSNELNWGFSNVECASKCVHGYFTLPAFEPSQIVNSDACCHLDFNPVGRSNFKWRLSDRRVHSLLEWRINRRKLTKRLTCNHLVNDYILHGKWTYKGSNLPVCSISLKLSRPKCKHNRSWTSGSSISWTSI